MDESKNTCPFCGLVIKNAEHNIFKPEFSEKANASANAWIDIKANELLESLQSTIKKFAGDQHEYTRELRYRELWLERKDRIIARLTTELEEEKEKVALAEKDILELRELTTKELD